MKKIILGVFVAAGLTVASNPTVFAADLAPATPVNMESIDQNKLEGWIIDIEYSKSLFRLMDPRGFQKRVVTKPGEIGHWRIGDKVRVQIDPDYKRASNIEKLY